MPEPQFTPVLLCATTGFEIGEGFGSQWADVGFAGRVIQVRRSWAGGQIGGSKSSASEAAVSRGPVLASYPMAWSAEPPMRRERAGYLQASA